ncbi:extracellular solute-binding protein [Roseospirillum parvum]|uniref:Putative spermidine/putrescine transport system substrate-binding protein n=1 Tax=Roseospirillum parvum TaxID=83401 RepID=A0A1G8D4K7_9PROT|nr:extracellular solute-binding protein [Roseospirillum parvum]SDH52483.1 putative spermidine/putrescine transport system substrate-binding protein [Roseospirillum parvum]
MIIRTTTAIGVALAALAGASLGAGEARAETTLTIVSWGGAYTMSQQKAYHEPYMKMHPDVTIINEDKSQTALAGLRAQHQAGNVSWDLVDILPSDALVACDEGLAEKIDYNEMLAAAPDGTPPTQDFIDGSLTGCFIPQIVYSNIVAFNTEMYPGQAPTTMADVFDLESFPGRRSLQNKPVNNLEWALAADGVPAGEIYEMLATPEGVERAFNKLETIKDETIWWEQGAQPPQLLADKEVSFASAYNGRIFNAQVNEGQPFQIIWDAQVFELDGWVVPAGGKNKDVVYDYLKFATDTQRLADQAKFISYGPARKSSAPLVGEHAETGIDMKPHMPTYPENFKTAIPKDDTFWADYGDELAERFAAWLAS